VLRPELLPAGVLGVIDPEMRCAHRELEARLRPFVVRRVSSPADADDVVQEIFLRLQRGMAGLRDEERFGPWVYQVARSALADHQRQKVRHPCARGEAPDRPAEELGEDTATEGLATCIALFVTQLPSPYREAITLTELEGMPQKAAARMLGVSLSGMKSRVQRGRERLRERLQAYCAIALDARGHVTGCEPRHGGVVPEGRCCEAQGPDSKAASRGVRIKSRT